MEKLHNRPFQKKPDRECTVQELAVFRNKSGKDLTDGQLKDLLTKGKTGVIKGFKSKENKPFDAAIMFDADYKTMFSFPPKSGNGKKHR